MYPDGFVSFGSYNVQTRSYGLRPAFNLGQADYWWLRSPDTSGDYGVWYVNRDGDVFGFYDGNNFDRSYGSLLRTPLMIIMHIT